MALSHSSSLTLVVSLTRCFSHSTMSLLTYLSHSLSWFPALAMALSHSSFLSLVITLTCYLSLTPCFSDSTCLSLVFDLYHSLSCSPPHAMAISLSPPKLALRHSLSFSLAHSLSPSLVVSLTRYASHIFSPPQQPPTPSQTVSLSLIHYRSLTHCLSHSLFLSLDGLSLTRCDASHPLSCMLFPSHAMALSLTLPCSHCLVVSPSLTWSLSHSLSPSLVVSLTLFLSLHHSRYPSHSFSPPSPCTPCSHSLIHSRSFLLSKSLSTIVDVSVPSLLDVSLTPHVSLARCSVLHRLMRWPSPTLPPSH